MELQYRGGCVRIGVRATPRRCDRQRSRGGFAHDRCRRAGWPLATRCAFACDRRGRAAERRGDLCLSGSAGPTPTPGPGDIIVIHNGIATGVTYTSIDAAITAASAGDTIEVGAGNYSEHVVIDKAVTLDGANSGLAGTNNSRGAESVITGGVEITAAGATIDGFTVSGSYDSVTLNGTDTAC